MSAEDYIYFDFEYDEGYNETFTVRCKYCGVKELVWEETKYGWRLFEPSGKQHNCKKTK